MRVGAGDILSEDVGSTGCPEYKAPKMALDSRPTCKNVRGDSCLCKEIGP